MKKNSLILLVFIGLTFCFVETKGSGTAFTLTDKKTNSGDYNFKNSSVFFDKQIDLNNASPNKRRKKKNAFNEGAMIFTVGYGVPNVYKWIFSSYKLIHTEAEVKGMGPFHAKFEYGLADKIGVGLNIDFATASIEWADIATKFGDTNHYNTGFKGNGIAVSVRGNWHFYSTKKLDTYAGINFGYDFGAMKFYSDDPNLVALLPDLSFPFVIGLTVGMRYYVSPNFAIYAELGYSKSLAQFGVSYKI